MRRIVLVTLAMLAVGSFVPNRADAMTVTTPAGIQAIIKDNSLVQDVACRRYWHCGPYGCGWRRVCARPYYYGYGGPYYYGGGPYYYGRPYYRRYWW